MVEWDNAALLRELSDIKKGTQILDGELHFWLGIEFAGKDCKMEDIEDKSNMIVWKCWNYTLVFKTFRRVSD